MENFGKYPNIDLMGLRVFEYCSGHGMSDCAVSADDLERALRNADVIEIEHFLYLLVSPQSIRKPPLNAEVKRGR